MSSTSVGRVFTANGLPQWWTMRPSKGYDGDKEKGQDYSLPLNTPIGSLTSGRVVYASQMHSDPGSSVGYIVQVEQADGSLIHYHHLRSANVVEGQYVHVGDVIGRSGGCPADGYGTHGCTRIDQYTNGPHIEVRYAPSYDPSKGAWNQKFVAPQSGFNYYASAPVDDSLLSFGNAGGCQHSINLPAGISICMDAGEDLFIRTGFILGGTLLITLALILFVWNRAQPVAETAAQGFVGSLGSSAGGEVGKRTAEKALDKKPIRRPEVPEISDATKAEAPKAKAPTLRLPAVKRSAPKANAPTLDADTAEMVRKGREADAREEASQRGALDLLRKQRSASQAIVGDIGLGKYGAADNLRGSRSKGEQEILGGPTFQPHPMGAGGKRKRERRPKNVVPLRPPRRAPRRPRRNDPPGTAAAMGG
jgi:hypothetical protein